jgi:uncharacterized protein YccT (UPF0319 family)
MASFKAAKRMYVVGDIEENQIESVAELIFTNMLEYWYDLRDKES